MSLIQNSQSSQEKPIYYKSIKYISVPEFKEIVINKRDFFVSELVKGYVYIVKNMIKKDFIISIRAKVHEFGLKTESSWNDTEEGAPNFHQIDNELNFFKIKKRAHVYNFFPWNDDTLGIFKIFGEVLELYRIINNNKPITDENNEEIEIVNRLQIHHYPSGGGYMGFHTDPDMYLKTICIIYMSEFGKDYYSGGLTLYKDDVNKLHVDPMVDVGDMVLAYPTIRHGCASIDESKILNWESTEGRWLFLLNSLPKKKEK